MIRLFKPAEHSGHSLADSLENRRRAGARVAAPRQEIHDGSILTLQHATKRINGPRLVLPIIRKAIPKNSRGSAAVGIASSAYSCRRRPSPLDSWQVQVPLEVRH